jgi:hypothetical protein
MLRDFAEVQQIGETHEDTLDWLKSRREPWLIVFDNADHPSLNIQDYFPGGNHGSILITTRLSDLAVHARGPSSVCSVSNMVHGEVLSLLLRTARRYDQELAESEIEAANGLLHVSTNNFSESCAADHHNLPGSRTSDSCNRSCWSIY